MAIGINPDTVLYHVYKVTCGINHTGTQVDDGNFEDDNNLWLYEPIEENIAHETFETPGGNIMYSNSTYGYLTPYMSITASMLMNTPTNNKVEDGGGTITFDVPKYIDKIGGTYEERPWDDLPSIVSDETTGLNSNEELLRNMIIDHLTNKNVDYVITSAFDINGKDVNINYIEDLENSLYIHLTNSGDPDVHPNDVFNFETISGTLDSTGAFKDMEIQKGWLPMYFGILDSIESNPQNDYYTLTAVDFATLLNSRVTQTNKGYVEELTSTNEEYNSISSENIDDMIIFDKDGGFSSKLQKSVYSLYMYNKLPFYSENFQPTSTGVGLRDIPNIPMIVDSWEVMYNIYRQSNFTNLPYAGVSPYPLDLGTKDNYLVNQSDSFATDTNGRLYDDMYDLSASQGIRIYPDVAIVEAILDSGEKVRIIKWIPTKTIRILKHKANLDQTNFKSKRFTGSYVNSVRTSNSNLIRMSTDGIVNTTKNEYLMYPIMLYKNSNQSFQQIINDDYIENGGTLDDDENAPSDYKLSMDALNEISLIYRSESQSEYNLKTKRFIDISYAPEIEDVERILNLGDTLQPNFELFGERSYRINSKITQYDLNSLTESNSIVVEEL